MKQEARPQHGAERQRARRVDSQSDRLAADLPDRPSHPLLDLQRVAGNRAVQRLIAGGPNDRPRTLRRSVLQRVLSPATAAMGRSATGDLLSSWAGANVATVDAVNQVGAANTATFNILDSILSVQAALMIAETEPAPGGAAPAVQPVTPTPVPVPSPTQQSEE